MDLSWILLVICVCLCYTVVSVHSSLVITCWEKAGLLAHLCVMFSCVFVTFPCGIPSQVWYLVVSIPNLCLLPYFFHYLPKYLITGMVPSNMLNPSSILFTGRSKMVLLSWILLSVCLCYNVLSDPCSIVITCWEKAGLLAHLCVMYSCVIVTSPCVIQDKV